MLARRKPGKTQSFLFPSIIFFFFLPPPHNSVPKTKLDSWTKHVKCQRAILGGKIWKSIKKEAHSSISDAFIKSVWVDVFTKHIYCSHWRLWSPWDWTLRAGSHLSRQSVLKSLSGSTFWWNYIHTTEMVMTSCNYINCIETMFQFTACKDNLCIWIPSGHYWSLESVKSVF